MEISPEEQGVSFHLRCGKTKRASDEAVDLRFDFDRGIVERDIDDEDGDASHRIKALFPESFSEQGV